MTGVMVLHVILDPVSLVSGGQGHGKQQPGLQSLSSWDSKPGSPPLPLRLTLAVCSHAHWPSRQGSVGLQGLCFLMLSIKLAQ